MKIYESGENYLETIYMLCNTKGNIRAVDLCNELGFSKPTVSVALKKFREENYVLVDENGHLSLTPKGLEIAERMYERHNGIAKFLMAIGVSEATAYEDACLMEHHISDESFEALKRHSEQYKG